MVKNQNEAQSREREHISKLDQLNKELKTYKADERKNKNSVE
jgi:hypothetical protein